MTTIYKGMKTCVLCGKTSEHAKWSTTSAVGSPDLDTRPPEMERSTIDMWIQTCPSCGYCAPSISERIKKASEVVDSDSYRQQLNNLEFPKLANAFFCYSLIQENAGKFAQAGWSSVHAAWACDDDGSTASAETCQKRAVNLLQKARANNQRFAEQHGVEEALMVDLLRRSGQFEEALRICDDGLKKEPGELLADILRFEKMLIGKADNTCHLVSEATKESSTIPTAPLKEADLAMLQQVMSELKEAISHEPVFTGYATAVCWQPQKARKRETFQSLEHCPMIKVGDFIVIKGGRED